jgi:hypothetical protein
MVALLVALSACARRPSQGEQTPSGRWIMFFPPIVTEGERSYIKRSAPLDQWIADTSWYDTHETCARMQNQQAEGVDVPVECYAAHGNDSWCRARLLQREAILAAICFESDGSHRFDMPRKDADDLTR